MTRRPTLPALLALALGLGCGSSPNDPPAMTVDVYGSRDRFDVPIDGLSKDDVDAFAAGDALFDTSLRPYDGLGPLYTRSACSDCHDSGIRGPGLVQKMVSVEADGSTPSPDQSLFPYGHTVHPLLAAGATTPIVPPADAPNVKVTIRVGPPILGRGYLEAVDDSEIQRVAAEQATRADAIHGRVNYVMYASQPNPDTSFHQHQPGDRVIGRFGLKARIATVDDFTADALQGDMGITSPLRPTEIPNPDGLTDDLKPGVDVTADSVNARARYVRTTAIPLRAPDDAGLQLFTAAKCAVCHAPSLKTRGDYPIALLAGVEAPVFTDMLLHDMGDTLADGIVEGLATGRDWRTAPLIGLRFNRTFMHDGRAHDVPEAIADHAGPGSEADESVQLYQAMSAADRAALEAFVESL
ncbi:MAG TPA: di-heme oxidoredictase family protein [Polyangia bacterium]|nr:di-heme oxidoredictase family protein [Polyangia bacterium]